MHRIAFTLVTAALVALGLPRTIGLPPKICGSAVMRFRRSSFGMVKKSLLRAQAAKS